MSEINDPAAVEQRIERKEREVQDFNTKIGGHNAAIRELEEGKAGVVKSIEQDKSDLAAHRKEHGLASD